MQQKRVIKVGGSLLDLPDLTTRIQNWLGTRRKSINIYLIGGGEICNQMRELDARFQFEPSFSHDCCIELMTVTARILSQILKLEVVDRFDDLHLLTQDVVFDSSHWIHEKADQIPRNWDFTSDSISALLARECQAELCLLKSIDVDADDATDNCFDEYSIGLDVEFVNLRK